MIFTYDYNVTVECMLSICFNKVCSTNKTYTLAYVMPFIVIILVNLLIRFEDISSQRDFVRLNHSYKKSHAEHIVQI